MAGNFKEYSIRTDDVADSLFFDTINNLFLNDSTQEYSVLYLDFLKIGNDGSIIDINNTDSLVAPYYIYAFKTPQIFKSEDDLIAVRYAGKTYFIPAFLNKRYVRINESEVFRCRVYDTVYDDVFVNNLRNISLLEFNGDSLRLVEKTEYSFIRMIE